MASDARDLFQQGVRAIRDQHDTVLGRQFLIESLRVNPENDAAWVWLSETVIDPKKKMECLNRALAINPINQDALDAKFRLKGGTTPSEVKRSTQEIAASDTASSPVKRTYSANVRPTDMGKLLESGSLNKSELFQKIVFAIGCLAIAIAMFLVSRANRADTGLSTLMLVGAIVPLLGMFVFLYSIIMSFGVTVEVYDNGIRRLQGNQSQAWRWDEFTALRVAEKTITYRKYGAPVYTMHTYSCRLLADNKVIFKLDKDIQKYRELGQLITQKTAPLFFEQDFKAYRGGETVKYGKIEVSREGIRQGRKFIAWSEMGKREVDQGWLSIQRKGKRKIHFWVLDVPNAVVFLMMIDKITSKSY